METIEQLQDQLAKVRDAIDAALTGKKYRIESGSGSRELERQSLRDLQAREQLLLTKIARMGGNGIRHGVPSV